MKSRRTFSLFVIFILLALLLAACDSGIPVYPTSSAPESIEEAPIAEEPPLQRMRPRLLRSLYSKQIRRWVIR